jgi:hypothetical protein
LRRNRAEVFLVCAAVFLAFSIVLGVAGMYPEPSKGTSQSNVIISDIFHLSPNEVRRQGLGAFEGGENITLTVWGPDVFVKNFSVITYDGLRYHTVTSQNITHAFTAGADYYEAVFNTNATQAGTVHFEVSVEAPQVIHPFSWISTPAKILFVLSLVSITVVLLKNGLLKHASGLAGKSSLPVLSQTSRHRLLALVVLSLMLWFVVLAVNSSPLGTFEDWYTDHARHPYVSSLFLKDGLQVFSQPLDVLASRDSSRFMFVTWPEMPHLYPIGSIALFLPFGILLQSGVDPAVVFKLEIALFLVFAHVCLYFFLGVLFKKDLHLFWKLVGLYIIYVSLVIYAADGMFDSVAFFFSLMAVAVFLTERYDGFLLLLAVSVLFKYQAAIFLLPFIIVGVVGLLGKNRLSAFKNKKVAAALVFACVSGFTAYLSAPYLMHTRPELIMNGVNAFSPNAQISWTLQTAAVLGTLTGTLVYAAYMLRRNSLLSLSAVLMLLPSFMLPYFQNWYLPFLFVYILVPQQRNELEATIIWLVFMIFVLSFGGIAFNPMQIFGHFQTLLGI